MKEEFVYVILVEEVHGTGVLPYAFTSEKEANAYVKRTKAIELGAQYMEGQSPNEAFFSNKYIVNKLKLKNKDDNNADNYCG